MAQAQIAPLIRKASTHQTSYFHLREKIRETLLLGQQRIEQEKVRIYWEAGKLIQQYILQNKDRAEYGKQVILRLSKDLDVGDDLLYRCMRFAEAFPQISASRRKLTWSHYRTLTGVPSAALRQELIRRAEKNEWTHEELEAKIRSELSGKPVRPEGEADFTPLKPKLGTPYTYRLIQPEQIYQGERPYLLLDLGFEISRRCYQPDLKAGMIVESVWSDVKKDYGLKKSSRTEAGLFTYKALIERVVDGDTLRVKIDLGFDMWARQYLRLRGLDAPEIVTKEGREAADYVKRRMAKVPFILLTTTRSDKYDRYLSDVFVPKPLSLPRKRESTHPSDFDYLNNELLEKKMTVRMRG